MSTMTFSSSGGGALPDHRTCWLDIGFPLFVESRGICTLPDVLALPWGLGMSRNLPVVSKLTASSSMPWDNYINESLASGPVIQLLKK